MLQPDEVLSCEPQGIACVEYFTFNFGLMPCLYPCSVQGWQATSKPAFEIHSLERSVKGNSVPMPKSVIRLILNSVLPRLLQRRLLRLLPQELGEYLLQAGKGFGLGGELHAWCVHGLCLSWSASILCLCTQGAEAASRCGLNCSWPFRHKLPGASLSMCASLGQSPSACPLRDLCLSIAPYLRVMVHPGVGKHTLIEKTSSCLTPAPSSIASCSSLHARMHLGGLT